MTFEQIKALIDILCDKGLQELEVERSDFRVRIVGNAPAPQTVALAPPVAVPASAPGAAPSPGPAPTAAAAAPTASGHTITSPIVGTYYGAPSPEADPYVQVGDRVTVGQVLCIVEAMKLMNEIESDVDGEVVEILPANAQPIEYGEPLFVIKTDS